jgi:hypothetical protein
VLIELNELKGLKEMEIQELFRIFKSRNKDTIKLSLRAFLNEEGNSIDYEQFIREISKVKLYNKLKIDEMKAIWKQSINPKFYYISRQDYKRYTITKSNIKSIEKKRQEILYLHDTNQIRFIEDVDTLKQEHEERKYVNSFNQVEDTKIINFLFKHQIKSICLSQRQLYLLKRLLKQEKRKPISIVSIRRLNNKDRYIDKGYFRLKQTKQLYESEKAYNLCRKQIDANFYCRERINCNKAIYTRIKVKYDKRYKDLTRSKSIEEVKMNNQFNCNYCFELREMKKTYVKRINKSYQVFYFIKNHKDITINSYIKQIDFKGKEEKQLGNKHYTVYLARNRLFNLNTFNPDVHKYNLNERLHHSYLNNSLIKDDLKLLKDTIKTRKHDLRYLKPYKIENIPSTLIRYSRSKNKYVKSKPYKQNIRIEYFKYFNTRREFIEYNYNIFHLCNMRLLKEKMTRKHIKNVEYKTKVNLLQEYSKKYNKSILLNVELGNNSARKRKYDNYDDESNEILVYKLRKQDKRQVKRHIERTKKTIEKLETSISNSKKESTKQRHERNINILNNIVDNYTKYEDKSIRTIQVNYQRKFSIWNNKQRNKFFLFFLEYMESKLRTNMTKRLRQDFNSIYQINHSLNYNQLLLSLEDYNELYQYFQLIYSKCIFNVVKKVSFK